MIKKIISIFIVLLISQPILYAKAVVPKPGTIITFSSANKIYSIDVKIIGYPENSPSECTFKKSQEILWKKEFSSTPAFVDISNNGKYFVFANWGRYDERGLKSISFYNSAGELLKTIGLSSDIPGWGHIQKTCFSGDGNYYVAGDYSNKAYHIILYHTQTQAVVWNKKIGLKRVDNILISNSGEFILVSTFDYENRNMLFSYLSRSGKILWEKEIEQGYVEQKIFIGLKNDGREFRIYDRTKNRWRVFENNKSKIILKKTIPVSQ